MADLQILATNPAQHSDSPSERKTRASEFENAIVDFLRRMDFEHVEGGRDNFRVNNMQVDACGGHEDTLIIVECVRKQNLGKASIREKIKKFRGCQNALEKGFRHHPIYGKYKSYQYVLAARNIVVRHDDYKFANDERPRIYVWDDNFIAYYEDLREKIASYAKYNLLGEIGIRPLKSEALRVQASEYTHGKARLYLFFIDPKVLLEVAYVARREFPRERYYQRIIKKKRLDSIAAYVNNGNLLPNNLIIAFGDRVRPYVDFQPHSTPGFKQQLEAYQVKHGELTFPRDYRSCWIVDGQHRLYSFIQVKHRTVVPVVAFKDLDLEGQCKIFLDINKYQKAVSPDLVWDLNGDMIPSQRDGIVSNSVKALNDEGPLHHAIYIPSRGVKKRNTYLKMAGLCNSIVRMRLGSRTTVSKVVNPFYSDRPEVMVRQLSKGLNEYLLCVKHVMEADWRLAKNGFVLTDGGISVMIRLFERIVSRRVEMGVPTRDDLYRYLIAAKSMLEEQYGSHDQKGKLIRIVSSEGGKDEILKEMILYIKRDLKDPLFGGEIALPGLQEINQLEQRLQDLIQKVYGNEKGALNGENIPEQIYRVAEKRMKEKRLDDYSLLHRNLTLGDCITIMRSDREHFYNDFYRDELAEFDSEKQLEAAQDHILKMRKRDAHSTVYQRKMHDEQLLRIFLDKMNRCLDRVLGEEADEDLDPEDEGEIEEESEAPK